MERQVTFVAISQINWPQQSRKYLMHLLKQIVEREKADFIIVAGHIVDGKYFESTLKENLKGIKNPNDRACIEEEFIKKRAKELNIFLPKIKDTNYHIVVAEKYYDGTIGLKILERLIDDKGEKRKDLRIILDAEAKVPIEGFPGVDYIRVLVPTKALWYYKNISGAPQRIINSFIARSSSTKPPLIIVGCTGVDSFLPFYEGVPCISLPALYKIDEQKSVENTVGIVVVKMRLKEDGSLGLRKKTYPLNNVISKEKEFLIEWNILSAQERDLLFNFVNLGSMSEGTLASRIDLENAEIKESFKNLKQRKFLLYNERANRYSLNKDKLHRVRVLIDELERGGILTSYTVHSCPHFGHSKTLYFTYSEDQVGLAENRNAIVCCGDILAGLKYEGSSKGEVLPTFRGYDKQEILAAHAVVKVMVDIFQKRLAKYGPIDDISRVMKNCLISFLFIPGNHDLWEIEEKQALPLILFEKELKSQLLFKLSKLLPTINPEALERLIQEKISKVGESGLIDFNGVICGISHPHKARTLNMSQRLQEVINYHKGEAIIEFIGNFHEAASVIYSRFNKTVIGVMAGAVLAATDFEHHKQKKVDHGFVDVAVCVKDGAVIWNEIEFISNINPLDSHVFEDRLSSPRILGLCNEILKKFDLEDLPWR